MTAIYRNIFRSADRQVGKYKKGKMPASDIIRVLFPGLLSDDENECVIPKFDETELLSEQSKVKRLSVRIEAIQNEIRNAKAGVSSSLDDLKLLMKALDKLQTAHTHITSHLNELNHLVDEDEANQAKFNSSLSIGQSGTL